MNSTAKGIVNVISMAEWPDLAVIAALAALAALMHLTQHRLSGKGVAGALSFGKWLVALWAAHVLDERVLRGYLATGVMLVDGVLAWLAIRAFLHDVYADVYLVKLKGRQVNRFLLNLLSFLAALVLVGMGLRGALNVDVGSILTSSAILTAVVGFSMQDTIGSLFSGLLIQTEKPFRIGDWIRLGEIEGQVAEITWRYTKLTTIANEQVLIPNNAIAKERLVNLSEPVRQVNLTVAVPAPVGAPPVKIKSALEDVLRKSRAVAPLPEPRVRLHELGLDSITYRLSFYVEDYGASPQARTEVLSAVWYEFRKQGIELPMRRQEQFTGGESACAPPFDLLELVKGVGLFRGMREGEIELLAQCAAVRTFAPGMRVVERGEAGHTMFIIASGSVSVRLGEKELSRLTAGDVFGEMALLTGEPRQADVVALEPVTCLEVDREAFRGVLDKNPVLVENVTRSFRERESFVRGSLRHDEDESAHSLFESFKRLFW
jgi:small-conductance mechanosensitive channel